MGAGSEPAPTNKQGEQLLVPHGIIAILNIVQRNNNDIKSITF